MTQQMYPGVVNSPQTELANAISDTDDTIELIDASVLPDGPNLATIGSDETAETIRYYAKSGNELTGVERGFQGAAKSWGSGSKVARQFTEYDHRAATDNIQQLTDNLDKQPWQPVILNPGVQVVQGGDVPAILHPTMQGRTLVNLLGRDGNCEDISKWTTFQSSFALEPSDKVAGLNSIKVTGTGGGTSHSDISKNVSLRAGKYYIAGCYIKNVSAPTNIRFFLENEFANVGLPTSWTFAYAKLAPVSDMTTALSARNMNGGNTSFLIDGVRLYEISEAEYDALDMMTADQVAATYPYVDDMKHVNAVYIENKGKNLLPPFSEWTLHANAVVTNEYSLNLNASAEFQGSTCEVTVLSNTTYTLSSVVSAGSSSSGGFMEISWLNSLGAVISTSGTIWTGTAPLTITSPADSVKARVFVSNNTIGDYSFANPMLNVGSEPLPFEPQKPSYLYLPDCNLRSNVDGSVADRLYTDGQGKPRVTRRFRETVIDGSLVWGFQSGASGTGYKVVQTLNFPVGYERSVEPNVIKFDGSKLKYGAPTTDGADYLSATNWSNLGNTVLSIPNSDSGWGESYAPTADEIKAYFNGWKMCNSDGSTPYTSGTKYWKRFDGGGGVSTDFAYALNNYATGYTPYRLMYQLAQSIDEPVTYEGSLMLHEGDNQIEIGTGIVVRESSIPSVQTTGFSYINVESGGYSRLSARLLRFMGIFRNGKLDKSWIYNHKSKGAAYGEYYAVCPVMNYDPTAAYSVTYLALDTYTVGIAPQTISAEYAPNIRESVESLVREVVEARTETSVLANTKAQKQPPQWIEAALLSDWTGFLRYLRNDEGYVTLTFALTVGITALNTIVCRLPFEYRSANNTAFTTLNNNTGSTGLGLGVNSTLGGVAVTGSTNFSTGHIIYGTVTYKGR